MATKQAPKGTVAQATTGRRAQTQAPAGRRAVPQTAAQAMAATLAALPPAATGTPVQGAQPTPQAPHAGGLPASTPLPANWVATAPAAAASAQVFAAYRLPNSLQAKGANLCGGQLGNLQAAKLLPGKPYVARSGHNAAWAATCTAMAQAAAATGGVPAAALVAAGVGAHSVKAYVKRGWLVQAPAVA